MRDATGIVVVDGIAYTRKEGVPCYDSGKGWEECAVDESHLAGALIDTHDALAAAQRETARLREAECQHVAIPESLAVDVLDEIESAIAAGRAMGHGAWAILNRVFRLLHPHLRADKDRFTTAALTRGEEAGG